jgi:co-chaperonin GroES (HSP10)
VLDNLIIDKYIFVSKLKDDEKNFCHYLSSKGVCMLLKMRNGNVSLEELASNTKTSGGIYIPQNVISRTNLRYGKVLDVGPGELVQGVFTKPDLEKGQDVIFDISRSETIEIDEKKINICNMVDIIAVVVKHLSIVPPVEIPNETA